MYKLNIGVGFSILQYYYLPHSNKSFLIDIIQQHRIILSDKIIHYYIEKAEDIYKEAIETYLDSIIYTNDTHIYYEEQSEELTALEEMIQLVEKNPMKTLLGEQEEFSEYSTRKIKLLTSQQVIDKEMTAIFRYSFPITNHIIKCNTKCDSIAVWFGHLFEGEKKIDIYDKFILTVNGIYCMKKYYLPYIKKGTEINIYCEIVDTCTEAAVLSELNDVLYADWDIHVYICRDMHDRYIQLDNILMSIGAGLAFLHKSGVVKKPCTLNITNDKNTLELPKIIKQLL